MTGQDDLRARVARAMWRRVNGDIESPVERELDYWRTLADAVLAEIGDLTTKHEQEIMHLINERDQAIEWADRLSEIAPADVLGEHSNVNNPWRNAEDYAVGRGWLSERSPQGGGQDE